MGLASYDPRVMMEWNYDGMKLTPIYNVTYQIPNIYTKSKTSFVNLKYDNKNCTCTTSCHNEQCLQA